MMESKINNRGTEIEGGREGEIERQWGRNKIGGERREKGREEGEI